MKFLHKSVLIGSLLVISGFYHAQAQTWGTNAVGRNSYVEVGLNACGVYGSNGQPAAAWGYHPNVVAGLGFVCDYQKNGWTTASGGGLNYCGDYFVPGSPVEGWALTFNGVDRINTNNNCSTYNIPGAITKWVNSTAIDTMEWTGSVAGMSILQRTLIPNDSLYFVTEIVLCNTTAATMTNVYYGRNVDPDNEQPWGYAFTTTNTIVSQPSPTTNDALVTALGPTGRCFLGLGARDSRARVNHGGFWTIPADDLYTGLGRTTTVGAVTTSDIAIGIGFQLGNLAPGECTCLSFVYVMSASMLGSALSATSGITVTADSVDITTAGSTVLCVGDSVNISLGGGAGSYTWTWSPAAGLSSTTGTSVTAFPTTTTTYTVVGTGVGFTCTDDTLSITITVDSVIANAGPDVNGCPGETLSIGLPPVPGHGYTWSPPGYFTAGGTGTPVSVVLPGFGDYTFTVTATDAVTGCTDTDDMVVHIDPNPPPTFTTADDSLCVGGTTTVDFTGDTTGATTYVWSFSPTTIPASVTGPGPHNITWTTPGMKYIDLYVVYGLCTTAVATDSVMIWENPDADIAPVADQCFDGHSFSFSNTGPVIVTATYSWTFGPDATPTASSAASPSGVTFAAPGPKWVALTYDNHGCTDTDTVYFNVNPMPAPSFTIADPEVCTGTNTTITFTGITSGATSYIWTVSGTPTPGSLSGAGPHSVSWSSPGMQYITLSVAYGPCTTSVYIDSIMVWAYPVANIQSEADQCLAGNSFSFTNLGFYDATATFLWTFGPGAVPSSSTDEFPTVSFVTAGPKYATLQVTQHGCVSTIDTIYFDVIDLALPTFSHDPESCTGDPITCTYTGPGIPAAGFTWTFTGGSPGGSGTVGPHSITYSTPGTYYITLQVSLGPCLSPVAIDSVIIWPDPVATIAPVANQCLTSNSFNFAPGATYGPTATFFWTFGPGATPINSTDQFPSGISFATSGIKTATLIVTEHGCVSAPVTINFEVYAQPVPDFDWNGICFNSPTLFDDITPGTMTNWVWSFADGGASSTSSNPTHTFSGSGQFNVNLTVTDNNGCTSSGTETVTIHPLPEPSFTYENKCLNSRTEFTNTSTLTDPWGSVLGTYFWNFGDPASGAANTSTDVNPIHNYTAPGTYIVNITATSDIGCSQIVAVPIFVEAPPALSIGNDSVCTEEVANLWVSGALPGTTVVWMSSPTSTTYIHTGNSFSTPPLAQTTIYYVSMVDDEGCMTPPVPITAFAYPRPGTTFEALPSTHVEIPNAIVEFNPFGLWTYNGIQSLTWTFGDGSTSTETNPIHQYSQPGIYTVTLTVHDENGCMGKTVMEHYIQVSQQILAWVPNAFTPNGDGINDFFKIDTRLIKQLSIYIYDRWGMLIYQSDNLSFEWDGRDVKGIDLQEGNYTWRYSGIAIDNSPVEAVGTVLLMR